MAFTHSAPFLTSWVEMTERRALADIHTWRPAGHSQSPGLPVGVSPQSAELKGIGL